MPATKSHKLVTVTYMYDNIAQGATLTSVPRKIYGLPEWWPAVTGVTIQGPAAFGYEKSRHGVPRVGDAKP